MVLQTSPGTIINGKANPGGVLAVKISDFVRLAQADDKGSWQVEFPEIILNEPFSIGFEGKDTSFTFNNIHVGKVYIIAGDGNLPVHPDLENRRSIPQPAQPLRVFIPLIKGNHLPQQIYFYFFPLTF